MSLFIAAAIAAAATQASACPDVVTPDALVCRALEAQKGGNAEGAAQAFEEAAKASPDKDPGTARMWAVAGNMWLAAEQPGYLGYESARSELGIAVSYWATEGDARAWKRVARHVEVQRRGRAEWYDAYRVRIATVEREYGHERAESAAREPMTEAAPIRPEH